MPLHLKTADGDLFVCLLTSWIFCKKYVNCVVTVLRHYCVYLQTCIILIKLFTFCLSFAHCHHYYVYFNFIFFFLLGHNEECIKIAVLFLLIFLCNRFVNEICFLTWLYVFTGSVSAVVPGCVRGVAEALYGQGSGRVCTGDLGQPPHRVPGRLPPGGHQTAVHRQNRREPALHKSW